MAIIETSTPTARPNAQAEKTQAPPMEGPTLMKLPFPDGYEMWRRLIGSGQTVLLDPHTMNETLTISEYPGGQKGVTNVAPGVVAHCSVIIPVAEGPYASDEEFSFANVTADIKAGRALQLPWLFIGDGPRAGKAVDKGITRNPPLALTPVSTLGQAEDFKESHSQHMVVVGELSHFSESPEGFGITFLGSTGSEDEGIELTALSVNRTSRAMGVELIDRDEPGEIDQREVAVVAWAGIDPKARIALSALHQSQRLGNLPCIVVDAIGPAEVAEDFHPGQKIDLRSLLGMPRLDETSDHAAAALPPNPAEAAEAAVAAQSTASDTEPPRMGDTAAADALTDGDTPFTVPDMIQKGVVLGTSFVSSEWRPAMSRVRELPSRFWRNRGKDK